MPQYYVENSHPAIIEKEIWEMLQTEFMRRLMIGDAYSGASLFVSKLVCGDCGKLYGKKKWHSTDKYTKEIYRCNDKCNKSHDQCKTPILTEKQIKEKFIKAYNQVMCKKEIVIEDTLAAIDLLTNTDELDIRILEFQHQLEEISQKVSTMVVSENLGDVIFVKEFEDFIKQTGFSIYLCKGYNPLTKGKVEKIVY